ncbi:DUF4236 domain-containing protein [Bhargavaea cecembensis]|uniref:DUF4236 domain-containing protein n=1 Tax=Bhargavaea cecembensis TaxID=394098 RepID=UPI000694E7E9|nr:DUF4236 domain-containing protein [Bhargavaea cecembensis]
MGFRFQRRIKIAPGVLVNVGKRGASMSVGPRGASVTVGKRGTYANLGIPGTGLSYRTKVGRRTKRPQRVAYEQTKTDPARFPDENVRAVEEYNAHVAMLTSVHHEAADPVDWTAIAMQEIRQTGDGPAVAEARRQLASYHPNWLDRLFNRAESKQARLEQAVREAADIDDRHFAELRESKEFAERVLSGDHTAWLSAIEQTDPFEDIRTLGSRVDLEICPAGTPAATLFIGDSPVVPRDVATLTTTGKLSVKPMAKKRYLLLYQDYVCSSAIRIARELFAILPVEQVLINVMDDSQADEPPIRGCILSVRIRRDELSPLNFEWLDPSDTIETFEHRMNYLKTKGFRNVEALDA